MGFGKKKPATVTFHQDNVAMLATEALAKRRSERVRLALMLTGEDDLLQHRWTQKAVMQMLGKMVGQDQPKTPKDLTDEYEASFFRNTEQQVVLPCRVIKAAIVDGATGTNEAVTKADLKRSLRVLGHTAPLRVGKTVIKLGHPAMKMDARIAMNGQTPDVRSRAIIAKGWTTCIVLEFGHPLTPDKVIAAVSAAGDIIGLCDYRPERGGDFGTFSVQVVDQKRIPEILKETALPEEMFVIPPEMLRAFNCSHGASDTARKAASVVRHVNGQRRGGAVDEATS